MVAGNESSAKKRIKKEGIRVCRDNCFFDSIAWLDYSIVL